jgi:uncharacterized integral membrane protein
MGQVDPPLNGGSEEKRSTRETARLVGIIVLIVYGVLLVLLNGTSTKVHLLFWNATMPLFIVIVLAAAIGFALGWLMSHRSRKRGG